MNLAKLLQLQKLWNEFTKEHPNMVKFLDAVRNKPINEGTNIVVTLSYPDGSNIKGGIIVKPSDIELFNQLKQMRESE